MFNKSGNPNYNKSQDEQKLLTFHSGSRSATNFTDTDSQVQKTVLTSNMHNFPTQERFQKKTQGPEHTYMPTCSSVSNLNNKNLL